MDSWANLSLYESSDLVQDIFKKRHGRELRTGKAREIASAVAQGREYFSAASEAGSLVRPLLQYYGVLSLCRSLILLLSPNLREASLRQSHGVQSVGWNEVLAADKPHPVDLEVKIGEGTFLSLLMSTKNSDVSSVFTGPYPSRLIFTRTRPTAALRGVRIAFQPLLSRICELRDVYERSFGKCASNYRAFVFTLAANAQSDIDLFHGQQGLPLEDQLRRELSIPADVPLHSQDKHPLLPRQEPYLGYRLLCPPGANSLELLPQIDNHPDGTMSVVVPFGAGFSISRIGRFFLLSYFLGTLARYHPSTWLTIMQGRQGGDFMLPIIRESMSILQRYIPTLIIEELER